MICEFDTARWLIFSTNGEPLIYYSHLTSIAIFLALFGLTFLKTRDWPKTSFRVMVLAYIAWLFCDLVLWANEVVPNIMFFWTIINLVEPLIFVGAFSYFIQFLYHRSLTKWDMWGIFALLFPTLVMAPIGLSVYGFDYTNCDRNAVESVAAYYNYFLEAVFLLLIVFHTIRAFIRGTFKNQKSKLFLISTSTSLLMLSFLTANFLGTLTGDYVTSQYGHIAVPIFAALLAYVTIKYESFEPKILLIDTLVVALLILLASVLFAENDNYQIYANIMAFVIAIPLGYTLSTNIRKEVRTRRQVEELAGNLEKINAQQVILIHFITHQIKGFVAKSRNIFSLLLEGDFGPLPDTMKPMVLEGFNSDTKGVSTIQEILNAANIKSGKVTYSMTTLDLKALVEEVAAELRPEIEAKKLSFNLHLPETPVTVTGDRMQLQNAIKNLIDNSVKYTPSGSVDVTLQQVAQNVTFTVKDTGVGITPDDKQHLFTEGGRGKESLKINVNSTGFGLYIVKNIVTAHKGRVWAESEGPGKGSTFTLELPA